MTQITFDKYVTSSVGNLYRGRLVKDVDGFRLYLCTKLGSGAIVGYCACNSQGAFGPLCRDERTAFRRAKNVSHELRHRKFFGFIR